MSAATAFVLTIGSMTSWAINHYLLEPNDLVYLRTLSFILVIAGVVQFTEMLMEKNFPLLYQLLGIFLPLITTNCAVLGIPLLNAQSSHTLIESALFGFGGAIGFSIVLILFASIREQRPSPYLDDILHTKETISMNIYISFLKSYFIYFKLACKLMPRRVTFGLLQ